VETTCHYYHTSLRYIIRSTKYIIRQSFSLLRVIDLVDVSHTHTYDDVFRHKRQSSLRAPHEKLQIYSSSACDTNANATTGCMIFACSSRRFPVVADIIVLSHRRCNNIYYPQTTMKFSSFALAAVAIAASTVNGFSAPKFAVRQVRFFFPNPTGVPCGKRTSKSFFVW
jgi:hypothetical protein